MVNPSPYMFYLQARGSILVASSPEILCHVGEDRTVTNRCSLLPVWPRPWPTSRTGKAWSPQCWQWHPSTLEVVKRKAVAKKHMQHVCTSACAREQHDISCRRHRLRGCACSHAQCAVCS